MPNRTILTDAAPSPIGPYSQAVWAGNTLYLSGQIAIDPKSGALDTADIASETHRIIKNIQAVLTEAGLDLNSIIKTSIFLTNMDNFGEVNQVYGSYFTDYYPARETVEVSRLPKDVNVEISVIAVK